MQRQAILLQILLVREMWWIFSQILVDIVVAAYLSTSTYSILINILRYLQTALSYIHLQMINPCFFNFHNVFTLFMNTIISIKLLLQLNYSLVSFIKSSCESYHNISLLQQQLLISIYLSFVFFDLLPLSLDVSEFRLIFLAYNALLCLESRAKLRQVLDLFSSDQYL